MGRAKQDWMEHQDRVQVAVGLCVEIDAIKPCDVHEDQLIDQMAYDSPEAVVAEILEHKPEALAHFQSRADMLECVAEALDDAGLECGICGDHGDS